MTFTFFRAFNLLTMKNLIYLLAAVALLWAGCTDPQPAAEDPAAETSAPPNVLIFLVDDLGMISTPAYTDNSATVWTDTSSNNTGVSYNTPYINEFATSALRYNYMYSTPLCAPSRAELITGRYPFRTGIVYPQYNASHAASEEDPGGYLANDAISFANIASDMGYYTAFGGKWNLRYGISNSQADSNTDPPDDCDYYDLVDSQKVHLNRHGFQETYGPNALIGNTIDYWPPQLNDTGYFPDTLNAWMLTQVNQAQASGQPFLIHYCFGLIHNNTDPQFNNGNTQAPTPIDTNATAEDSIFADRMVYVDSMVKNIMQVIDENDSLYSNTVVIIVGDNGTETNYYSEYQGQRINGAKGTLNSCGSRVPFMVRWPGVVTPRVSDDLLEFADIYSTLVDLVGGSDTLADQVQDLENETGEEYIIDGQSFLYSLTEGQYGDSVPAREMVYCQMQADVFVANKDYQLRNPNTSPALYYIGNSPSTDSCIAPDENGGYSNPDDSTAYAKLDSFYQSLGANPKSASTSVNSCGI